MQYLPSDPYSQNRPVDNGPGAALAGIGNVFGDPMQNALQQQKQALTAREIAGQGQLGALFAHPGAVNTATGAAAIANGVDPDKVAAAIQLTNNLTGGVDSDLAARAATGSNHYTTTPLFQQRAEAAAAATAAATANTQAASQLRVAGLEPVQVVDGKGAVGWSTKADVASGKAAAQGLQPLVSPDMVKGAIAGHNLLPQPGGGAVAPQAASDSPAVAAPQPSSASGNAVAAGPAPFDPSSPTASIAGLLAGAMPQPSAPASSPVILPSSPAPAANVGAPTADAMSDDQKTFLGLTPTEKLQIKQTGADTMGNPIYSKFNPQTGEVTPLAPQGPSTTGPAPSLADATGGLHGDQFLSTLPPEIQPMVKGIASGQVQPPSATTRQGHPNPILAAVMQYDPTFDASNTAARFNTAKDFTPGGKSGAIMGNAGSALGHLGDLMGLIPGLNNMDHPIPGNDLGNSAKNAMLGGSSAAGLNQYKEALQRVSGELEKFYSATGGTEADRAASAASLSPDKSPSELYAASSTLGKMLQTKVEQLGAQRSQIMGPGAAPFPIYDDKAKSTLSALDTLNQAHATSGQWSPTATAPTAPGVTAPPAVPNTPVGTVVEGKGGTRYIRMPGGEQDQSSWKAVPSGGS